MMQCMITFRSVTPAQRGEGALRRAGIACTLRRTPRKMEEQGCGYALTLSCSRMQEAVEMLRRQGISYRRIYRITDDGPWEELSL